MKINGPGQPPIPGTPGEETTAPAAEANRAAGASPSDKAEKRSTTGKSFAETVSGPAAAGAAAPSPIDRPGGSAVHDLAAALRSGQLDGRAAVDKVIDRIVTAQVGPDAPTHVRDKVQAALRDALDDDPLLADKLRSL